MTITGQDIVSAAALCSAILTLGGVLVSVIKWVLSQNKQSQDIRDIRKHHDEDMEAIKEQERQTNTEIQDELCVISYALLAALDGLKQLHCNGEVSKAHDKLEKHINQKAHGQTKQ